MIFCKKTQNKIRKIKEEIKTTKEAITRAEKAGKKAFAKRLYMMLEDKQSRLEKISNASFF